MSEPTRNVCPRLKRPSPEAGDFAFAARSSRFLFNQAELEEVRGRILQAPTAGIDFRRVWEGNLRQAEAYAKESSFTVKYPSIGEEWRIELPLEQPAPHSDPTGYTDFPYWTMYSRAIEERLTSLSATYLISGESEFGNSAKRLLVSLCGFAKWYEFDHRGAEGNLSNAHFTIGAAIAYDSLYHLLSTAERDLVRRAIMEKGLQPMRIDFYSDDMHNIVAAKQVAMLYGSLAIADEWPEAGEYIDQAYAYIRTFLDRKLALPETEGLLYDNVAARHVLMAADVLRRAAGNEKLTKHPYIRDVLPERFLLFLAPGFARHGPTFPNVSDSFLKLDVSYLMSMLASLNGHPVAMWYTSSFEAGKATVLTNLRTVPQAVHPDEFYRNRKSQVFPLIGWAALRSGWGDRDHLLTLTSSLSAQGHNHKDQNNIVLNVAGEWLLTNPGYQDYVPGPGADYTTGTVGHNSLLIDGLGQQRLGGGLLQDAWMSEVYQTVTGNASECYGGLVKSYLRKIIHADNRYYIIVDLVKTDAGRRAELLFHTKSDIRDRSGRSLKPGDAPAERSVHIVGEAQASLYLDVLYPGCSTLEIEEVPGAEKYGPHIKVSSEQAAQDGRHCMITLLVPEPTGAFTGCRATAHSCGDSYVVRIERTDGGEEWHRIKLADIPEGCPQVEADGSETPISSDGDQAYVSVATPDNELRAAAVVRGTKVLHMNQPILQASLPVDAALQITGQTAVLEVASEAETVLHVYLPRLDVSAIENAPYGFDCRTGMVELTSTAGRGRYFFNLTRTGRWLSGTTDFPRDGD